MPAYKITAFGSARMDIFTKLPEEEIEVECGIDRKKCVIELGYGEKIPLEGVEYWVGGNAANLTVGMQRLGVAARLVAELGEGLPADMSKRQFEAEGIGMEYVSQTSGVAAGLGGGVNYQAERTILSYYPPFRPQFPDVLVPTEWAYLTSIGEGFEEYYGKVLSWVRTNKARLGFNPGGRQIRKGREWMGPYLRQCEVLLVNREEGAEILADGNKEKVGERGWEVRQLLSRLFELGPKLVVITDGPSGAYVCNGQGFWHMPIIESPVVERTGAGDAFSTGFLAAVVSGHDIETALKWGTANSASVIGKVGAQQGLLAAGEIDGWMKKLEGIRVKEI